MPTAVDPRARMLTLFCVGPSRLLFPVPWRIPFGDNDLCLAPREQHDALARRRRAMHLCYNTQQEIQPDLPHRICHGLSHARACVYILAGGPCPSLVSCLSSSESSRRRQSAHLLTPPHPLPHVQLSETIPVGITFPSFQYKQYKLVCPRVRIFVRCWSVACNCLIRSCHVYHRHVRQRRRHTG